MTILHMDTEQVKAVAYQLQRMSNDVDYQATRLSNSARVLDGSWSGPSSRRFDRAIRASLSDLRALADAAAILGRRLSSEVDEWLEVDNTLGTMPELHIQPIVGPPWDTVVRPAVEPDQWSPSRWPLFILPVVFPGFYPPGFLRDVGEGAVDAGGRVLSAAEARAEALIHRADLRIDRALSDLLQGAPNGSRESISFAIERDATFKSLKVLHGAEVEVARLADGTYQVVVSEGAMAGGRAVKGASGEISLGETDVSLSSKEGAEALAGLASEMTFSFDPNKPGDMTEMGIFLASLGGSGLTGAGGVVPSIPVSSIMPLDVADHLTSVELAVGSEGSAEFSVSKIVEIVGGEAKLTQEGATGLERSPSGEWQLITRATVGMEAESELLVMDTGAKAEFSYENIHGLESSSEHTRVTVDLTSEVGQSIKATELKDLIPGLDDLALDRDEYQQVVIEYEFAEQLHHPDQVLVYEDGQFRPGPAYNDATITIRTIHGQSVETGISGEAGAGVTIGAGFESEVGRESEMEYVITPGPGSREAI